MTNAEKIEQEIESLRRKLEHFATVQIPTEAEIAAARLVLPQLDGTPLGGLARALAVQAEEFEPDRTGVLKVKHAIEAINRTREVLVGVFIVPPHEVLFYVSPYAAMNAAFIGLQGMWEAQQKLSWSDFFTALWKFVSNFSLAVTGIIYGKKVARLSALVVEIIRQLRERRMFQSRVPRKYVRKRTRD